MRDMITSLPNRPLTAAEVKRLRAREGINRFVACDPRGDDGVRIAVALVDSTVVAVTLEEYGWTHEVLAQEEDLATLIDVILHRFQE